MDEVTENESLGRGRKTAMVLKGQEDVANIHRLHTEGITTRRRTLEDFKLLKPGLRLTGAVIDYKDRKG